MKNCGDRPNHGNSIFQAFTRGTGMERVGGAVVGALLGFLTSVLTNGFQVICSHAVVFSIAGGTVGATFPLICLAIGRVLYESLMHL